MEMAAPAGAPHRPGTPSLYLLGRSKSARHQGFGSAKTLGTA
ncbi:hypothetical protein BACCAP_01331 [Pseudoflavonifractor capillosus ATCC 29799]|uniref:Uncharacterized protein n=1 Tax=Pseudoflavonifractor capillosus ATCC 29799 TaxID=411467 RepID=A6NT02_9FIRM|nr:hypothetical protein BACCAP_01331 [Pseudoflavonifractor capillosus ATCC 29799]